MQRSWAPGQRVRINEEDDPPVHVGKLAVIERVEADEGGEIHCTVKVDWGTELVSLPASYLEPVEVKSSSLLANELFLPWDVDDPNARLRKYLDNRWLAGHILETLLFYERVVIPTVDFSIIVPLVHWLGPELLVQMLEKEALSFVRYRGGLAYVGNGNGLATFQIQPGESRQDEWWLKTARAAPHEAVTLQITNRLKGLEDRVLDALAQLVEVCTVDTALPEFTRKVEEETYKDIVGSEIFSSAILAQTGERVNLKRLPGIADNQMRSFASMAKPAVAGDPIDIVLRLGMLNLEAYLAEEAGTRDMVTDRGFGRLLSAKLDRYQTGATAAGSFSSFISVNGLPDITAAVMTSEINTFGLWEFRNRRVAGQFREWFERIGPSRPADLQREYIRTLRSGSLWERGPLKVLRFITMQAITSPLSLVPGLGSLASLGISVADSFLIERLRLGFRPRYFIDDLQHRFFE